MYVCICNKVTDKAIIQAIDNGAGTVKDLKETLSVASQCGRCATCARDLLEQAVSSKFPMNLQAV